MADSRPGGIEKIAHLFIAGNGASNVRARDNSPLRWSGPAAGNGNGIGHGARAAPPASLGRAPEQPVWRRAGTALQRKLAHRLDPPPLVTETPEKRSHGPGAGGCSSLLSRAKVAAVLSGHMGPLAGPAAELFAKTLAREGSRAAMLYGPADLACLHQFSASDENGVSISRHLHRQRQVTTTAAATDRAVRRWRPDRAMCFCCRTGCFSSTCGR